MASPKHLKILHQGVDVWNKWRAENENIVPDLGDTDLSRANLEGANLMSTNLSRTNLRGANLVEANLDHSNLFRANLEEASIVQCTSDSSRFDNDKPKQC